MIHEALAQRIRDGQHLTVVLPRMDDSREMIRGVANELEGSRTANRGRVLIYDNEIVASIQVLKHGTIHVPFVQRETTLVTTRQHAYMGVLFAHLVNVVPKIEYVLAGK